MPLCSAAVKGWSLILGLVIACGPTAPAGDAGRDGWAGEPEDAGVDAGFDAGRDATIPTADAGPMGTPRTWESASLYLLMVDRFANGADDPDDPCVAPSHPRRFHGGDLVGLRDHLEYFTELGVDTLWVTPLVKQIGLRYDVCGYHGYWAGLENPDDGALEPLLGTAEDFDSLLESLHARDMRLVLDMVVNHAGYDAPITRSHPEWFHPRSGCEALGDPEETCPLSGLPDFDQSVPAAREYLVDHSLRWVERFDIDGIRMDTVKHVPLDFFRDTWLPSVRGADDGLFIVGELFDGRPYAETTRYLDAGFDGLFDFRFHGAIVAGLGEGGSLDPVAGEVQDAWHTLGPERARRRAIMLENHDLPRFASQVQGATASERVARMHQGLALLMLTPGIPQLYAGTELGMMGEWPENRRDMPAWPSLPRRARPTRDTSATPARPSSSCAGSSSCGVDMKFTSATTMSSGAPASPGSRSTPSPERRARRARAHGSSSRSARGRSPSACP